MTIEREEINCLLVNASITLLFNAVMVFNALLCISSSRSAVGIMFILIIFINIH